MRRLGGYGIAALILVGVLSGALSALAAALFGLIVQLLLVLLVIPMSLIVGRWIARHQERQ